MAELQDKLKRILQSLPESPGVYKYFDAADALIYVGKAQNLKKRVSSYFTKNHFDDRKTAVLVNKICNIEFTLVDSEIDALLLENSLIKKYQPRFNINLKDDKTYPYIKISNERFPKVFQTRRYEKDGSEYYGPYASVTMMYTVLDMIRSVYPIRNCNLNLTEKNITDKKFKVCLEYHIGNCRGPCVGLQSEADYEDTLARIRSILKGKISEVIKHLQTQLNEAVKRLQFEEAALIKKRIDLLDNYQSKSTIVSRSIDNIDVFSIADDEKMAFVNFLKVADGMIIQTQTLEFRKRLSETPAEILELAIAEVRGKFNSNSKEIIVPFPLDIEDQEIQFIVPKAGEKKKLLDLSLKNVLYFKRDRQQQYEKLNPELRTERVLTTIMNDLRLKELPRHMECFDNSNLHGTFPVSAMVCFRDAKASKKDYRHYNVETVVGANDFATMKEVIKRRYSRLINEKESLPQLIVVDGGKGQLSSAVEALKEIGIYGKVAIIGIAKKLEEIYFPEDPFPMHIDKKSETLKVIQQMRDEAHRFGITHHRKRRNKGTLVNELESIKGIGKETATQLLRELKSIKKIKEADKELIENIIGKAKAKLVIEYFDLEKQKMG